MFFTVLYYIIGSVLNGFVTILSIIPFLSSLSLPSFFVNGLTIFSNACGVLDIFLPWQEITTLIIYNINFFVGWFIFLLFIKTIRLIPFFNNFMK